MRRTKNHRISFSGLESLEQRRLLSAELLGEELRIDGTEGDDAIVIEAGEEGQVVLFGVDGVEDGTVFDGVGSIIARLKGGDDQATVVGMLLTAAGTPMSVRIQGGEGNDTLIGGDGSETLLGGEGDDEIDAGGGDDEIRGGAGDDLIIGGDGNDEIVGGKNADEVRGGRGSDTLIGGFGFDNLIGGAGGDTVVGGGGRDEIVGGAGADALYGGAGADMVRGGGGDDNISAGAGNDVVDGGKGDDWLFAGDGQDQVAGGDGSDLILAPPDEVVDRSEEDAKWTDPNGNEIDLGELSEEFWTALETAERALRTGRVERLNTVADELGGALGEQAGAFFDILGDVVDDKPIRSDTFADFQDTVREIAPDAEEFFTVLEEDLAEVIREVPINIFEEYEFLNSPDLPPSFGRAMEILHTAMGDALTEGFWSTVERLVDNQERFSRRLETLMEVVRPEQVIGLDGRVGEFLDQLLADGFDPRVDRDAFEEAIGDRLPQAFGEFDADQRDALAGVIRAGSRRESAVQDLMDAVNALDDGRVPDVFWNQMERAGREANGLPEGTPLAGYDEAIRIATGLAELDETFWQLFDAMRQAEMDAYGARDAAFAALGRDEPEDHGALRSLGEALIDAGYGDGTDLDALLGQVDPLLSAWFSGKRDTIESEFVAYLDAIVSAGLAEEAVLSHLSDLAGGELPTEFFEAWDRVDDRVAEDEAGDAGEDDGSQVREFLYRPHVPPSFIEAMDILEDAVGDALTGEFWTTVRRFTDNQARFMDRMDQLMQLVEPDQLVGLGDRVGAFVEGLINDGFDPRADGDAFDAEMSARLPDAFSDFTPDQQAALDAMIRAGARRESVLGDVEDMVRAMDDGTIPDVFWEAFERARFEANGLPEGSPLGGFDEAIAIVEQLVGGALDESFWQQFDQMMQAGGQVGQAFEALADAIGEFNPIVEDIVHDLLDAFKDAGYEEGGDLNALLDLVPAELAAWFEVQDAGVQEAFGALLDAELAFDAAEDATLDLIEALVGGDLPDEFWDAWNHVAGDDGGAGGDGDDGGAGGDGTGDDGTGDDGGEGTGDDDGVNDDPFTVAIEIIEDAIGSPLGDDFWQLFEDLMQAMDASHQAFDALANALGDESAMLLANEVVWALIGAGYTPGDDIASYEALLSDEARAWLDALDEPQVGALIGALDATILQDQSEQMVLDFLETAMGGELPQEFWDAWILAMYGSDDGGDGTGGDGAGGDGTGDDGGDGTGDDGVGEDLFTVAIGIVEDAIGSPLGDDFWQLFESFMQSWESLYIAYDALMNAMGDDVDMPIVDGVVQALVAAGYQVGEDPAGYLDVMTDEGRAWFEAQDEPTIGALTGVLDSEVTMRAAEQQVIGFLEGVMGGELPQEFWDAWNDAVGNDFEDGDDVRGLDGVMPTEFYEAVSLAESLLGIPFPQEFYDTVELLVQSVSDYAARFSDVLATMDGGVDGVEMRPILDLAETMLDLGYAPGDALDLYLDLLDPVQRDMIEQASDATRSALIALFDEGFNREELLDAVENTLFDLAGDVLTEQFFDLWAAFDDQIL